MATTATAFFPGASSFPNTTQYPGQGTQAIIRARYSTDDVSVSVPTWNEVINLDFRAYSVARGRDNELSEFAAASGTVTFDNRDRAFDPLSNSLIRPFNRIWLYEEAAGEVHDVLKGYVLFWELDYPGGGWSDAVATANVTDEFAVLASMALETTDPPRETYQDLVASDQPFGYWNMNEDPAGIAFQPLDTSPPSDATGFEFGVVQSRRADRRAFPSRSHRKHG